MIDWSERFLAATKEIERLQSIVDKLPKTADGVPVTPRMQVWCKTPVGGVEALKLPHANSEESIRSGFGWVRLYQCYSTREAAESAGGE